MGRESVTKARPPCPHTWSGLGINPAQQAVHLDGSAAPDLARIRSAPNPDPAPNPIRLRAEGEWMSDARGWWYRRADGSFPKDATLVVGGPSIASMSSVTCAPVIKGSDRGSTTRHRCPGRGLGEARRRGSTSMRSLEQWPPAAPWLIVVLHESRRCYDNRLSGLADRGSSSIPDSGAMATG